MASSGKIPCTIITGALGSGKTTLLNHILQSYDYKHIAIIENEFGEVGINTNLSSYIFEVEEEILSANRGCLCRTVRRDLIKCLKRLKKRTLTDKKLVDLILIETTGFADPAVVAQTFLTDEFVSGMCSLDSILTLVDAKRFMQQLEENKDYNAENEVAKQLAFADVVLLNKTDLVDKEMLVQIKKCIYAINPAVPIKLMSQSQIDMNYILGLDAWSLDKLSETDDSFRDETTHNVITCHFREGLVKCYNMAGTEVLTSPVPSNEEPFGLWLSLAAKEQIITQGRLHLVDANGDDIWVEPLQSSVSSVGIDIHGEVEKDKFNKWITDLLREKGEDLFRYKGILALRGRQSPFVFQGMRTCFSGAGDFHRSWLVGEQRRCKIHVMGNNLNRDELVGGFVKCMELDDDLI